MPRRCALALLAALAACAPVDPGGPGTCAVPVTGSGPVRVFVVGHHVALDDAVSLADFQASFERHRDAIGPCLRGQGHTLVLFPEDSGLAAWFLGRQAMLARHAGTSADAFNFLYAQVFRAADEYRARFPGVSVPRGLTLALADRAWRAMDRTFGGLALSLGAWVVTSANLPPARLSEELGEVLLFRDPDATGPAYVATSGEVANLALVYAPDGRRFATRRKVFLTDVEEQLLDLATGTLPEQAPVELPFGKLGVAISRDAWYPPFLQRLEDTGAELLVQPEAFSGWVGEETGGDWLPDVMTEAGWTAVQKYPGFALGAAPMLVGNLLDTVFDGQVFAARKARPGGPALAFVGSAPRPGLAAVGAWSLPDAPVDWPLAERQAALRDAGRELLPGGARAGQYRDSVVAVDVDLSGGTPVPVTPSGVGVPSVEVAPADGGAQRQVALAWGGGRLFAAWSDGRSGRPEVRVAASDDEGASWGPDEAVAPRGFGPQQRPALAWVPDGGLWVAWQEGGQPGSERVRLAQGRPGAWGPPTELAASTGPQWEPALAVAADGTVAIAWTDFVAGWAAPLVRWKCLAEDWTPSRSLDDSLLDQAGARTAQLQPALVATAGGFAAAWLDYRGRDWAVFGRTGLKCGDGPAPAQRVSAASATEVLAADPALLALPDGGLLAAWDEVRDRRAVRTLGLARFDGAGWVAAGDAVGPRVFPSPVLRGGAPALVVQDLGPGKNALALVGPDLGPSVRLDDTGSSGNQLMRPRALGNPDGGPAVVVYEDDRSGRWRLRALRIP